MLAMAEVLNTPSSKPDYLLHMIRMYFASFYVYSELQIIHLMK